MENSSAEKSTPIVCLSCQTELKGRFCHVCGEKRIDPDRDYSLAHFVEEVVDGFTHFDSKFFKSMKCLLVKPGFLTQEYVLGRRKPYMKPIQIFILTTVFFYLVFPKVSSFYSNPLDLVNGFRYHNSVSNTFSFDMTTAMENKRQQLQLEQDDLLLFIRKEAAHLSKAALFMLIPFFGLSSFLLFRKRQPKFVPHLIYAMHSLSFYIVLDMLFVGTFKLLQYGSIGDSELYILLGLLFLYQFWESRNIYGYSWGKNLLLTIPLWLSFILWLVLYRQLVTIAVVAGL